MVASLPFFELGFSPLSPIDSSSGSTRRKVRYFVANIVECIDFLYAARHRSGKFVSSIARFANCAIDIKAKLQPLQLAAFVPTPKSINSFENLIVLLAFEV